MLSSVVRRADICRVMMRTLSPPKTRFNCFVDMYLQTGREPPQSQAPLPPTLIDGSSIVTTVRSIAVFNTQFRMRWPCWEEGMATCAVA